MQLSLRQAVDTNFIKAMNAVMELNPPAKVAYNLTKNMKKIDEEMKSYDEQRIKTLKKYCALDDNGELKTGEDKQCIFNSDADKELFIKEINDLMSLEFDCHALKLDDLNNVKDLKGTYVAQLFPIIEEK